MKKFVSFLFGCCAWACLLLCWKIDVRQIEFINLLAGMVFFTILQVVSDISRE